jgi:hypothetical protein
MYRFENSSEIQSYFLRVIHVLVVLANQGKLSLWLSGAPFDAAYFGQIAG